MKKVTVLLVLGLIVSLPVTSQPGAPSEFSLDATGTIQIGPDGGVLDYRLDKGQKAAVEAALDQSIRGWRFEPILVEGRAVVAKTRLRIRLTATPLNSREYALKVCHVQFGEPDRPALKPPMYPPDALRQNMGARVVLVLRLDADGNVTDVHTEQVSLGHRPTNGSSVARWRSKFENASVATAREWKFGITELLEDEAAAETLVRIALVYIAHGSSDNVWEEYMPGPLQPVPWVTATSHSQADTLGNGDMQPLVSRFKLTTPLAGTML